MFNSGKTHSAPQFNAFVMVSSTIESRASAKSNRGISVESTATGSAIGLLCKPSANKSCVPSSMVECCATSENRRS